MQHKLFDQLPEEAIKIRKTVFMDEQGFCDEFDETDRIAKHIVIFEGKEPIGTCRFFKDGKKDIYLIGRIAVLKSYRGKKIGAELLQIAETQIKQYGGKQILLHAQKQAAPFYNKQGYQTFGAPDFDEGCPHIWMKKDL